jgi:hypothetical protein
MSRQRVVAVHAKAINSEKLWGEASTAWPNLLDISDVDGDIGFDFDGFAPSGVRVQTLVSAHDPLPLLTPAERLQLAADKALVIAFFDNPSGTATDTQRDNVIKAVIRYLRRAGNDA